LSLVIVYLVNFLYAVYCQSVLWYAAHAAKRRTLAVLDNRLEQLDPANHARRYAIEHLIDEIRIIRGGAFAGTAQQPLTAILVAFVGLGLWQVIQPWVVGR
jgi:hypothetical protein